MAEDKYADLEEMDRDLAMINDGVKVSKGVKVTKKGKKK